MGREPESAGVAHGPADACGVEPPVVDLLLDAERQVVVAPGGETSSPTSTSTFVPALLAAAARLERVVVGEQHHVGTRPAGGAARSRGPCQCRPSGASGGGRRRRGRHRRHAPGGAGEAALPGNVGRVSHSDSFGARSTLEAGGESYEIFRLDALRRSTTSLACPYSLKVLLENLLRHGQDGGAKEAVAQWSAKDEPCTEIAYTPARC